MRCPPRKIARNPASSSSDSQPNEYQIWPTLTIDWYSSHGTVHATMAAHTGAWSNRPSTSAADTTTPPHATVANRRSE